MVVLERGQMFSNGGNQYLQPDYLSPLPTTLDAKKSPLALLAQTCSQIGAESGSLGPTTKSSSSSGHANGIGSDRRAGSANGKQLIDADDSSPSANNRSPLLSMTSDGNSKKRSSPSATSAGKNVEGRSSASSSISRADSRSPDRPVSASTMAPANKLCNGVDDANKDNASKPPAPKNRPFTASELSKSDDVKSRPTTSSSSSTSGVEHTSTSTAPSSSGHSVPPIIRSGVEVLQGQMSAHHALAAAAAAGYPFGAQMNGLYGAPPGSYPGFPHPATLGSPYDPASFLRSNPYYYPGLLGAGSQAQSQATANALAAAAAAAAYRPYLGMFGKEHHQLAGCRDPFCVGGCQMPPVSVPSSVATTVSSAGMSPAGRQPCLGPGCQHCDLHRSQHDGGSGGSTSTTTTAPSSALPYVCNWIAGGDSYCGKRFRTSEELLTHLRTHTAAAAAAAAAVPDYAKAGLPSPAVPPGLGAFQRAPMTPDLRYHPYAKSPSMQGFPSPNQTPPVSLASSFNAAAAAAGLQSMQGFNSSMFNQQSSAAALAANPYYSPYSALYAAAASRMGL